MKNFIDSCKRNNYLFYFLGLLFILVIWYVGFLSFNNDYIIPSISQTLDSLKKLLFDKYTYEVLGHTLIRLFISISVCFILGVVLAALSKLSNKFKAFVKPLFTLLKTLPVAVVIILLLVMLKSNSLYYIVGVVILPIIYEACINGLDSIDKNITDEVKMDSKLNFYIIFKLYIPLIFPYIFTSLLQSIGLGLKVLVMAEFISNTKNSIGYEILYYKDFANEMSFVYAWSIILILFVLIIDSVINIIKSKSLLIYK